MLELFKSNPDWNLARHKHLRTLRIFASSLDCDLSGRYGRLLQNLLFAIASPHLNVEIFFRGEELLHGPGCPLRGTGHEGGAGELEGCNCFSPHTWHRNRFKLLGGLHEAHDFRLVLCVNVRRVKYAKRALEVLVEALRHEKSLNSLLSDPSIVGVVSCKRGYGPVWGEESFEIPNY